jgi:K(+)-stimulated pyrophosphate-energized sodium pump
MSNSYDNQSAGRGDSKIYWVVALVLGLLLLLLPWLFNIGPNSWKQCAAPAGALTSELAPAAVAEPAAQAPLAAAEPAPVEPMPAPAEAEPAPAAPEAAPAPVTAAPPPAARVYFALDRYTVPSDADSTVADVVSYLKANPAAKARLAGFHDPQGRSVAYNRELANNRSRSVRAVLEAAGISRDRIEIDQPRETTGTGSNAEARRVEVSVLQ